MNDSGQELIGIGTGSGKHLAYDAAVAAISSPLLDFPIEKAKGVVFTVTGNSGMSLQEVDEVARVVSGICAPEANIIFGSTVDETYADEISVTVVATSFDVPEWEQEAPAEQAPAPGGRPPIQLAGEAARAAEEMDPYAPPAPDTRKPRFWSRF